MVKVKVSINAVICSRCGWL